MTEALAGNIVSAFTEEQTSRLTGISVHQLRYWDRTKFFTPQFAADDRRAPYSRVYSFMDIAALRVLHILINQYSVSVRHLREVARKLCALDNSAWHKTKLFVLKKKVNFVDPADGKQKEVISGQYAIGIPLEKVMSDTRRDINKLSDRGDANIGKIEQHRNVVSNAAVIAGTRIPVSAIRSFFEAGFSVQKIMLEYPSLTENDIKSAIEFDPNSKAA